MSSSPAVVYAIVAASRDAMIGVAFYPVFHLTRVFDLTMGAIFAVGAYTTFALLGLGLGLVTSLVGAIAVSILVGATSSFLQRKCLRANSHDGLSAFVFTLGIYFFAEALLAITFGSEALTLSGYVSVNSISLGKSVYVTTVQTATVLCALVTSLATQLMYSRTNVGISLRAVADNSDLAVAFGVNCGNVVFFSIIVSSVLMSLAGILQSMDTDLRPTMGFNPVAIGAVASVLSGHRGPLAAAASGAVLGVLGSLVAWISDARWQATVPYVIFLGLLAVGRFRNANNREQVT